jgi:hypothetical protein
MVYLYYILTIIIVDCLRKMFVILLGVVIYQLRNVQIVEWDYV